MRRTLLMAACSLLLAAPVAADPFLFRKVYTQSNGTATLTLCEEAITAGAFQPCGGGLLLSGGAQTGHVAGTSAADASIASGVMLKSGTTLDVWRENTGTSESHRYAATGTTTASIFDSIVVNAPGVGSGFFRLVFDVTGGVTELTDFSSSDGFNPTVAGDFSSASGNGILQALSTVNASATFTGPGTVTLDVPMFFNVPQSLTLQLHSTAQAEAFVSEGYRVVADFLHTAVLTNALVLAFDLQVLADAVVQSEAGIDYRLNSPTTPAPVPEPSTLLLIATGAAALMRRRTVC